MILWKGVWIKKVDKNSDSELEMLLFMEIEWEMMKEVLYVVKLNDLFKVNFKVLVWLLVFGGILVVILVMWFYVLEDLLYIW